MNNKLCNLVGEIVSLLRQDDDFALITHVSPDGDTIGASLAIMHILHAINKQAVVICEHIVPDTYMFMPGAESIIKPAAAKASYKYAIAVDCASIERMGDSASIYNGAEKRINIDHHASNTVHGDINIVDGEAAATAEIVFGIYDEFRQEFTQGRRADIATCLYCAISTDTGHFSYSNTTPAVFSISAELLRDGIDPAEINRKIYRSLSLGKSRLMGYVLSSMQMYGPKSSIGAAIIMWNDLNRLGAKVEDIEGMIDGIRDVDAVEIAIILRECMDGSTKVSMRSKREVDVNALAAKFGGGGHTRAAGFTFAGSPQQLLPTIIEAAVKSME